MNISNLKQLLKIDSDESVENIRLRFDEISGKLFRHFYIAKGDYIYDFLEIEFYFYNQYHQDKITYPRATECGLWYFHSSGVDITFESDENHYGGILIRSLLKSERQHALKVIAGPLKCEYELFDRIDVSGSDEFNIPRLEVKKIPDIYCHVQKRKRKIPENKQCLARDEEYCYYVRAEQGIPK